MGNLYYFNTICPMLSKNVCGKINFTILLFGGFGIINYVFVQSVLGDFRNGRCVISFGKLNMANPECRTNYFIVIVLIVTIFLDNKRRKKKGFFRLVLRKWKFLIKNVNIHLWH